MLTSRLDFVMGDGMRHPRVAAQGHIRAHLSEHFGGLLNALPGNVGVWIARTQEGWSSSQVSGVRQIGAWRADQSACKRDESRIFARMGSDEFCRQARALRETGDHYPVR